MNTCSAFRITSLLFGLFLTSSALAHPAPYSHYHPAPAKKKVVYRTTPAPPTRVIVVEEETVIRPQVRITAPAAPVAPAPVAVTVTPTPAPTVTVTAAAPRTVAAPRRSPISLGLRATGSYDADETSPEAGMTMGGAGAVMRTRLGSNFGMELTIDALVGEGQDFTQTTVPVFASATYRFLPESSFQVYALAGLGADFTRREFLGGRYALDRVDVGAQVGLGAEIFITDSISLSGDIRGRVTGNLSTEAKMRTDCIATSGDMTGFCDNIQSVTPGEKFQFGAQFGLGANIYF